MRKIYWYWKKEEVTPIQGGYKLHYLICKEDIERRIIFLFFWQFYIYFIVDIYLVSYDNINTKEVVQLSWTNQVHLWKLAPELNDVLYICETWNLPSTPI